MIGGAQTGPASGRGAMEIARVDCSVATFFGVHSGLAMGSTFLCGSEEQKQQWLPPMSRLEKVGAFGLTEPDVGSGTARGLTTTAKRKGNIWTLNGSEEVDRQRHLGRRDDHPSSPIQMRGVAKVPAKRAPELGERPRARFRPPRQYLGASPARRLAAAGQGALRVVLSGHRDLGMLDAMAAGTDQGLSDRVPPLGFP